MNSALKFGLLFALIGFGLKLTLFNFFPDQEAIKFSLMGYSLCALLCVTLGFREARRAAAPVTNFLEDMKLALRPAVVFAVGLAAIVMLYYSTVDTEFFEGRIEQGMELVSQTDRSLLPDGHPNKALSDEEFIERQRENMKLVYSPFPHATWTLIGFLISGSFYAGLIVVLFRKVPAFRKGLS